MTRRDRRRARGRDWFEGSRTSAVLYLVSLAAWWGGIGGAVLAAHSDSVRWFDVAAGAAAASTWVVSVEARAAAGGDWSSPSGGWTSARFEIWLFLGGGVRSATNALRPVPDGRSPTRDSDDHDR